MAALTYRPAIDGLRSLALVSVFIFHLNHHWLPGGFVGVDVFFVISGYLITSIINKDCRTGTFSLGTFYQRRIGRIFPAYVVVALTTMAFAWWIYSPQDLASAGANLAAAALSIANLKYMSQGNYFEISSDSQPLLHYWSLSVEEQFYILFPLFFLLLYRLRQKYQILALAVLCAASFLACVLVTSWKPIWAFYLLPTRAWELFTGCLLAVIADRGKTVTLGRWASWFSAGSLGLILLSFVLIKEGAGFPGFWALLPVSGTLGVLMLRAESKSISEKWLAAPPLVLIGRISYSLYLCHWPIFSFVDYKLYLASEPVRLALKIGLSLLAAVFCYRFVENPGRIVFNRQQFRWTSYGFAAGTLGCCVILGIMIRKANYVNADINDVAGGGIVFPGDKKAMSVVLMGDSNGSMYGKVLVLPFLGASRRDFGGFRVGRNFLWLTAGIAAPRSGRLEEFIARDGYGQHHHRHRSARRRGDYRVRTLWHRSRL